MINEFLQFLKKQKLAICFARKDLLFLLSPLKTFHSSLPLSRLFRRRSPLPPTARIELFLRRYPQSLPSVLAVPLALDYGFRPFLPQKRELEGEVTFKKAIPADTYKENRRLLVELAERDWPRFPAEYLLNMLDIQQDMRLFASELEKLGEEASGISGYVPVMINWHKTSKQELVLNLSEKLVFEAELPAAARRNLADAFFRLLFLKSRLVAGWSGVAFNQKGEFSWLDFTSIVSVGEAEKFFARNYLQHDVKPENPMEHMVKRTLDLLRFYCSDIDLSTIAEKISCCPLPPFQTASNDWAEQAFSGYKSLGLTGNISEAYMAADPSSLVYLLDSRRYLRDSRFKKSSFYYWAPLLVIFYFLYRFF